MKVRAKMVMAIMLLADVVLAGCVCLSMRQGKSVEDAEYIACVTHSEEEAVEGPKIALTFDDGPDPLYTEQLLDGLKKRGAKASFFVMGKQAEAYPELILRMQKEGHLIGNHTYNHVQLKNNNRDDFKAELKKTNEMIFRITGQETEYVRPPYGSWDKSFETELTMIPVLWTIDPMDWCSDDVAGIVRRVTEKAEENAVILMHDEYKSSVEAALEIVDILQKQGYEFVTVEELLFD